MEEELRSLVRRMLSKKEVDGVLSLRSIDGCVAPHLFSSEDDISQLVLSPRYPVALILPMLQAEYPEARLGAVIRGCDERALIELAKRKQVKLERIVMIGVACSSEEAEECVCSEPYPRKIDLGERVEGMPNPKMEGLLGMGLEERLEYWARQFEKCIKCFGCKNACPLCDCETCILEEDEWVKTGGRIPPEFPIFHLIKAYHMADRCVECRECEIACPAQIPLSTLYGMVRRDMKELFGYRTGMDVEERPPLVTVIENNSREEG